MRAISKLPPFLSPDQFRSENMRAIKSRGNRTTEQRLRAAMNAENLRGWTTRPMKRIGSPDFVFLQAKVAVFVDGCFWHGCPRCGHVPKTNTQYWKAKIDRNRRRDRLVRRIVHKSGYMVVRIWECDLKTRPHVCVARIRRAVALK